jgi:ATP-dependent DNA helicase RecG
MIDSIDWRLETLPGVGAKTLECLHAANMTNLWQLVCHIPTRYEDYTRLVPPHDWLLHLNKDPILIEGRVEKTWAFFSSGKRLTYCQIRSGDQSIRIGFFHLHPQIKKQMEQKGSLLRCYGSLILSGNILSMYHPKYWIIDEDNPTALETTLTPIYKAISGVSASRLQKIIRQALSRVENVDYVLVQKNSMDLAIGQALQCLHAPQTCDLQSDNGKPPLIEQAHYRLAEEEAAFWRSLFSKESCKASDEKLALPCVSRTNLCENFIASLEFVLTQDQRNALIDIQNDLQNLSPMRRLLQGDVGSGKTVVATLAMLQVIDAGFQAALLVPTVVLAKQHAATLQAWLAPLGILVELCISEQVDQLKEKKQKIANGEISLVVGTHALLTKSVTFQSLALVVIDEQHRFGVKQRQALVEKGVNGQSHVLMMSATPIPRSLAHAFFGVTDCSFIKTKPDHRKKIETSLISSQKRHAVLTRVLEQVKAGKQVFWVCPRVDEDDEDQDSYDSMSALQWFETIQKINDQVQVALLHGRMKAQEKIAVLERFSKGDIGLLVSTVVIEVGVDVPAATIMVIDHAQMFGLAQLHQLRGRVGRSDAQSYCVLLYSQDLTQEGVVRLQCLKDCDDGFELAEKDLAIRGPGHIIGFKQSGYPAWRFLQWPKHQHLFVQNHDKNEDPGDSKKLYVAKLLWGQKQQDLALTDGIE